MLQYTVVGIQNDVWTCLKRADYKKQLEHVANNIRGAVWMCQLDLPVRLVALCEGALGGFAPWGGGEGHFKTYKELAPEIPGEETDFLGELCKEMNFYLIGQMQAKDKELMEDRVFNIAFIIDPNGKVIHKQNCPTGGLDHEAHAAGPPQRVGAFFYFGLFDLPVEEEPPFRKALQQPANAVHGSILVEEIVALHRPAAITNDLNLLVVDFFVLTHHRTPMLRI